MKKNRIVIILNFFLLVIFLLSLFSFTNTNLIPDQNVCAATCLPGCCGGECGQCPGDQKCTISNGACSSGLSCDPSSGVTGGDSGVACLTNVGSCTGGYNLFNDSKVSNVFNGEIDVNKIGQAIEKTGKNFAITLSGGLNANKNKLCLSANVQAIIPAYQNVSDGTEPQDLQGYFGDGALRVIPRKCIGDLSFPSQSKTVRTNDASSYSPGWGCCPENFQFLTASSPYPGTDIVLTTPNRFSGFGIRNNLSACCPSGSEYWYAEQVESNGNITPAGCLDKNKNIIAAFDDPRVVKSSDNPAILGAGLNTAADFSISSLSGSDKVCPSTAACATTSDGSIIPAADLKSKSGLSCTKCFNNGEAIGISGNKSSLLICDSSELSSGGTIPAKEIGLCNASGSDTIACLSGGVAPDSDNYKACCACRTKGGVWTGIGCTDTTPLGIITGIIRIVFGVVGGIALLQLIIAGIMYQTGNEERIKQARENIIKTLTGLAVLIFSILILRIIGINVLDILPVGSI